MELDPLDVRIQASAHFHLKLQLKNNLLLITVIFYKVGKKSPKNWENSRFMEDGLHHSDQNIGENRV